MNKRIDTNLYSIQNDNNRFRQKLNKWTQFFLITAATPMISVAIDGVSLSTTDRIDLNITEPIITDTCWLDVQFGEENGKDKTFVERIEIALYGLNYILVLT